MADAVTSQTIFDGARKAVMKFTNISDGGGETAVAKVDVSALASLDGLACTSVNILKIEAITRGMAVDILWDATTDVICLTIGEDQFQAHDFSDYGGIPNNSGAGKTGDVVFTTIGAVAGDRYTIILELSKNYG
jgi:hypothetical protein